MAFVRSLLGGGGGGGESCAALKLDLGRSLAIHGGGGRDGKMLHDRRAATGWRKSDFGLFYLRGFVAVVVQCYAAQGFHLDLELKDAVG